MCYTNPRLYFYFFYGRPRTVLLDWLLKTEEGNISYEELKMSAQDRSRWSQWRWKPVIWQSTTERFNWISFRDADVLLQMTEITLLVYMSTCVCFWSVWSDKNALKAALALLVKSCAVLPARLCRPPTPVTVLLLYVLVSHEESPAWCRWALFAFKLPAFKGAPTMTVACWSVLQLFICACRVIT